MLSGPHLHHLQVARGWLELGHWTEADEEIERISEYYRTHPNVLEVRWQIYAKAGKWKEAAEVGRALVKLAPGRASSYIFCAYATRRDPDGGALAALEALRPAAVRHAKLPLIPFSLACYACQAGRMNEAKRWLIEAILVGGNDLKLKALAEPDLIPLRRVIKGL